jgi:hypothetical protein
MFESFVYDKYQHLIAYSEDPDDDDELLVWAPFIHQIKGAIRNYFVEGIDSSFYRDVICFIGGTFVAHASVQRTQQVGWTRRRSHTMDTKRSTYSEFRVSRLPTT